VRGGGAAHTRAARLSPTLPTFRQPQRATLRMLGLRVKSKEHEHCISRTPSDEGRGVSYLAELPLKKQHDWEEPWHMGSFEGCLGRGGGSSRASYVASSSSSLSAAPRPTVNGNTVRSFSTHGHQSAAQGSSTNA
jgi:hypothetical protein